MLKLFIYKVNININSILIFDSIVMMQFIEIKPNNNKNINDSLLETINKLLASNTTNNNLDDEFEDIYVDHNDYFIEHTHDDPINYINDFFCFTEHKHLINYDIMSFDFDRLNNRIHLMLSDKNKNSTTFINSIDDNYRKENFNLLASTLTKYYTNSSALFGSVFIISINCSYYTLLDEIQQKHEQLHKLNCENIEELIEPLTKQLNSFTEIYYSFNSKKIIESFMNVCFVKIFANKTIYIYARDILENFIKNDIVKFEIFNTEHSIIKLTYEAKIIYVKYMTPLINSHRKILNIINYSVDTNLDNKLDNIYFINLSNLDIEFLLNH